MKIKYLISIYLIMLFGELVSQNQSTLHKNDGTYQSYSTSAIDTFYADENFNYMTFTYERENITTSPSEKIDEKDINLKNPDKPQSLNLLQQISFLKDENKNLLFEDIIINTYQNDITVVIPYLTDFSNLKFNFKSTGSYAYLNDKKISSGDECDFTNKSELKIIAFNGDIRTYTLTVRNSGLPIINISTDTELNSNFIDAQISISKSNGENILNSSTEIKGRGSHFKTSLKNSYNIKFENKTEILDMFKAKRWVLLSNAFDKSLIRSSLAFEIAKQYFSFEWTPATKPIELVINNKYLGSYTLVEQIRLCEGRMQGKQLFSAESSNETEEDKFCTNISKMTFVMQDPETGILGTNLIRLKDYIDEIEENLESGIVDEDKIDLNSFADWFVLNELFKNEEALTSNAYMVLTENDILKMGPIWDLSKTLSNEYGDSYEDFILKNNIWFDTLLKNTKFQSLVKTKFQELSKNKKEIENIVKNLSSNIEYSVVGNEATWHKLGSSEYDFNTINIPYNEEIEKISDWITNRIDWLNENFK